MKLNMQQKESIADAVFGILSIVFGMIAVFLLLSALTPIGDMPIIHF